MNIRKTISDELWGATDLPNRMTHTELENLIDSLTDLTQRIVDAHTEPIIDQLSYTKSGREILAVITDTVEPVCYPLGDKGSTH